MPLHSRSKTVAIFIGGLLMAFLPALIDSSISGRNPPSLGWTITAVCLCILGGWVSRRQLRIQHRSLLDAKILISAIGIAILGAALIGLTIYRLFSPAG